MKKLSIRLDKQLAVGLAWLEERRQPAFLLGLVLLALAAAGLLLWSSAEHGIGVRSDSVDYVWSAESLADGIGLGRPGGEGNFKPMVQFPPLYSTLLSIFELVGVGAWTGARWLAAVFFAANVALIGLVVLRLSGARLFALAAAGFALLAPAMFEVNLWAMTEAPYVSFVLLGFLLLDDYFRDNQQRLLFYAAISLGLALLTRYVGVTALGAAGLVLLLRPGKPWLTKIKEGALLAGVAGLPMGLWLVRNMLVAGTATNKIINYHAISAQKWAVFEGTLSAWLAPLQNFFVVGKRKLLALIGMGIVIVEYYRVASHERKVKTQTTLLGWMFLVYVPAYLVLVFFSVLYTGAAIPLDDRMMYPVYTILIAAAFACMHWLWVHSQAVSPALGAAVLLVCGLLVFSLGESQAETTLVLASESRQRGKGYALAELAEREAVLRLNEYTDEYVIYTDNVHQLYYYSGRLAYLFPVALDTATQLSTGEDFARSLQDIQNRLDDGQRIMFVFFFWEDLDSTMIADLFPEMELVVGGEGGYLYVSEGE